MAEQKQVSLSEINIDNENTALNVMVAMINIAQKRGAFSLEESSKCWECVRMFIRQQKAEASTADSSSELGPADASSENVVMSA